MAEPKPLTIAQLFSSLVGRAVNFTQVLKPPVTNAKQAYGTYLIKPADSLRIVQLDLPLLGSFGGSLLGIPSETVKERLMSPTSDEPLRDAMHEILNVASTIVSIENRAIFQTMFLGEAPKTIMESLKNPAYRSYFTVTVNGYEGGAFSIFAPI
jgi:hypothetical protein